MFFGLISNLYKITNKWGEEKKWRAFLIIVKHREHKWATQELYKYTILGGQWVLFAIPLILRSESMGFRVWNPCFHSLKPLISRPKTHGFTNEKYQLWKVKAKHRFLTINCKYFKQSYVKECKISVLHKYSFLVLFLYIYAKTQICKLPNDSFMFFALPLHDW